MSPYAGVLQTRRFVEINESVSDLLSEDWDLQPQYRFACAQVLAGSILLHCNSRTAVMVNTCESHGRTKSVDGGCPSRALMRQKGEVWPTTMPAPDGPRLVIGTQTSSLRLDTLGMGSVGGSKTSFQLTTADDSKAVRIFLDLESVGSAFDLARDGDARHADQPYSVFTLVNFDQSQHGSEAAAGSMFKAIAMGVIKEGENAKLDLSSPAFLIEPDFETLLSTLKECRRQCGDTKIASTFDAMIGLFSPDTNSIPIIGNRQLNSELEILAKDMFAGSLVWRRWQQRHFGVLNAILAVTSAPPLKKSVNAN
ncbi:hypothetical protein BGZ79_004807 [Entomortierella chlamydospora]|nr:hypothetical protein BGZ79_004807 [Entomortierella chlamydospora]